MRCCRLVFSSLFVASIVFSGRVSLVAQHAGATPDRGTRAGVVQAEATPARSAALQRIVRGLNPTAITSAGAALRVEVDLEVIGLAPTRKWLDDEDTVTGAPTYGAPTHDELLTALTPVPLRSTAPYRRLRPSWSMER